LKSKSSEIATKKTFTSTITRQSGDRFGRTVNGITNVAMLLSRTPGVASRASELPKRKLKFQQVALTRETKKLLRLVEEQKRRNLRNQSRLHHPQEVRVTRSRNAGPKERDRKRKKKKKQKDKRKTKDKLQLALEEEDRRNKEFEETMSVDERKRKYNSMYEAKVPTEEELEAYKMKRLREEDPMAQFMSKKKKV
jgi:hypothetical protein